MMAGMTDRPWMGKAIRAAQILAGLGLLTLLWHAADGEAALAILAAADPAFLLAALVLLMVQTVLSAIRWRLTAGRLGITLGLGHAIKEYYLAQIVNQSLPGGMIGDAGRAVRARGQAGLIKSGQAVVFERLAGQAGMFTVMAVSFAITLGTPGGLTWPNWVVLPIAVIILGGIALVPVIWLAPWLPGAAGRGLGGFRRSLYDALLARPVLPRQVALSLATAACNLAAFACCALAVDAALSLPAILTLVPLILFTMLIPLSVSGWGLREGAATVLFPVAGATAAEGLAASIAFGLIFILAVLPGIVPLWMARGHGAAEPATKPRH